jgi:hypothetical protein
VNSERAQAYGQTMKTLEDLSASKLHSDEQDVIREAADALFFCEDLEDDLTAEQALATFYDLVDRLMESDRLIPETAGRLTAYLEACGPLAPAGVG